MDMRGKLLWTLALVALAGLAWVFAAGDAETVAASTGTRAPAFTLEDQDGRRVSLANYSGKVVVLEWVNPDCPFVQRHYRAGTMTALANKYGEKGVVWLAVNSTNSMGKAENGKWVASNQLSYPILDDREGEVGRLYGARTTPHIFIIDKTGTLVYQGGIDDDPSGDKQGSAVNYADKALAELVAGKSVSTPETKPYGCAVKYAK
jgi:peroxiredoxin